MFSSSNTFKVATSEDCLSTILGERVRRSPRGYRWHSEIKKAELHLCNFFRSFYFVTWCVGHLHIWRRASTPFLFVFPRPHGTSVNSIVRFLSVLILETQLWLREINMRGRQKVCLCERKGWRKEGKEGWRKDERPMYRSSNYCINSRFAEL